MSDIESSSSQKNLLFVLVIFFFALIVFWYSVDTRKPWIDVAQSEPFLGVISHPLEDVRDWLSSGLFGPYAELVSSPIESSARPLVAAKLCEPYPNGWAQRRLPASDGIGDRANPVIAHVPRADRRGN